MSNNSQNTTYIGVRVPNELHAQIMAHCQNGQCTISEWVRAAIIAAVHADPAYLALGGISEGFQQAQKYALFLAHAAVEQARSALPDSYEEAVARYGPPRSSGYFNRDD